MSHTPIASKPGPRYIGLDVIRAVAILCVLLAHAAVFFQGVNVFTFSVLPGIAFTGVELFFGLSGFLIGSILLSKKYSLKVFYLKRLMKIVPPYLLILLIIFIATGLHNPDYFLAHTFFVHTLFPQMAGYFPVSWSLAIEFWFYLLVPLLLLNHVSKRNVGRQVLIISVATLAVLCLARLIYVINLDPNWEFGVHRFVPLRFDTMIFGVVAAIIARQHRRLYNILTKPVVVIGSLVVLIASTWYFGYLYSHFAINHAQLFQSVGLTIVGASIMVLILFALKYAGSEFRVSQKITKVILFISLTSYSLYLVHLFVFLWINTLLGTGWVAYGCALVVSVIAAWIFYESVEKWALKLSGWLHKKYFAKDTPTKQPIETEIARQP